MQRRKEEESFMRKHMNEKNRLRISRRFRARVTHMNKERGYLLAEATKSS